MGFKDLQIRISYSGLGEQILTSFLMPALSEAVQYDRVTSFFTTESLVAIATGLDRLRSRKGRMRLVMGIHDVPPDLVKATTIAELSDSALIEGLRKRITAGITNIKDEIDRNRLATTAWMIQDGLLSIKVAIPSNASSRNPGIFHNKQFILRDENGDIVAAVGSPNETARGLGGNIERISVFKSWELPQYTEAEVEVFERLWGNRHEGLSVLDMDAEFANEILKSLESSGPIHTSPPVPCHRLGEVIEIASRMPSLSIVSGHQSALFPHQELALLTGLSRWPVRALLADEVGLGKTFEAGSILKFLLRHAGIRKALLLVPKAVVHQWQGELNEHFGLEAWIFDSSRRTFIAPDKRVKSIGAGTPILSENTPDIAIISSQLARGSRLGGDLFSDASLLPDLLVVDEAHAARVKPDVNGKEHPTLLWQTLSNVCRKIPHLLLATATPMQIHWREYHALLNLLGLPNEWADKSKYHRSLELLTLSSPPELSDAEIAARLIRSSLLAFRPADPNLSADESILANMASDSDVSIINLAFAILKRWPACRSLLVKIHPARFLTIRNTKTALEGVGYKFPVRKLPSLELDASTDVKHFYADVDDYLQNAYFKTEESLHPHRTFPIGFVRSGYEQRLASSLEASLVSLSRRRDVVTAFQDGSYSFEALESISDDFSDSDVFDEDDLIELDNGGLASYDTNRRTVAAARRERAYLNGLIATLERILSEQPDPKMNATVRLLDKHLELGDKVLVFSRYTDTVDAAIKAFLSRSSRPETGFAIYTGSSSELRVDGKQTKCTRQEIRRALDTGLARIVFCSDAASEGLNLQSARVLINIDVPWNPGRLEQRIGRVARLGQKAETVEIYNLWYPDSIESRIYSRLLERRDLFELAVGQFPQIVSSAIRDAVSSKLTGGAYEADPISELNDLKNEMQFSALKQLWSRDIPSRTQSEHFRVELAELAADAASAHGVKCLQHDGVWTFSSEDEQLELETYPGGESVISLQHDALKWLAKQPIHQPEELRLLSNDMGPVLFEFRGQIVPPNLVPRLLTNILIQSLPDDIPNSVEPDFLGSQLETWLPNPYQLSIPIPLEREMPTPPKFAPETLQRESMQLSVGLNELGQ